MSDNERFYDEEIAPELARLAQKCIDRGLPFLAVVEYAPGDRGRTECLGPDRSLAMTVIGLAARAGDNLDGLAMAVARHLREKGIPHNSIALKPFLDPDPAKR